ncbi:hypothetical protein ACIBPB_22675 [Micromonospora sp. NPDC049836]|uniref:hypothetical protein n=1 Tax=Micromonospora sp. NPDC049836 TaxID=3364274 RepID=UPI0037BA4138
MTTEANARPAANGTGVEQVGQTSSHATHLPPGWHEQADYEGRWQYAEGYAAGYAAAERAIASEITEALGVRPMEPRKVIRWLVAGVGIARKETPA